MSETFTITKEQIEYLVGVIYGQHKSGKGIEESLRSWFPAAFEPEEVWEEVPLSDLMLFSDTDGDFLRTNPSPGRTPEYPLRVSLNQGSRHANRYKIESGRIYRRREK